MPSYESSMKKPTESSGKVVSSATLEQQSGSADDPAIRILVVRPAAMAARMQERNSFQVCCTRRQRNGIWAKVNLRSRERREGK